MSFRSCRSMLVCSLLLLAVRPALGQQQLGTKAEVEDTFLRERGAFTREYVTGTLEPKKPILDLAAQYYVYRVTWPASLSDSATMAGVIAEFKTVVDQITQRENVKKNQKFVDIFAPYLVARFRQLTDLEFQTNQKALLNGVQMLPLLGRIRHDDVGKYLGELLDDPAKHDAIKLYAAKGLRENFPIHVLAEEDWIAQNLKNRRDSEVKRIEALERFILRQAPTDLSEEEVRAFMFVRREAIAAMAAAGAPAVSAISANKKGEGDVKGAVAPTLIRVLIPTLRPDQNAPKNDMRLKPLPGLAEKVEAAIGVLNMHPEHKKLDPAYQPQLAAYAFGRFIRELGEAYNEDLPNLKDKNRRPPVLPWKIVSKRLEEAWHTASIGKPGLPADFKKIEAPVVDILRGMYEYNNVADRLVQLAQLLKEPTEKQRGIFPGMKSAQPLDVD